MLKTATLLTLLSCFFLSGCAYHLGAADRKFPGGYEYVAVPVFKNMTQETGTEVYFTNALVTELERSKIVNIADKSAAQVTVEGTIRSITYTPSSQTRASDARYLPTGTVLTTEYYINVDVNLVAKRNSDQKVIWTSAFQSRRSYTAPRIGLRSLNSSNALYNHSARYQNIQAMATDMMTEAHDRLTENF